MGKTRKSKSEKEIIDWQGDLERFLDLGKTLDLPTKNEWSRRKDPKTGDIWIPTKRDEWIEEYLKIRTKKSGRVPFVLNPVQREYSRVCLQKHCRQNIVLKARQMGITSYIAARFFLQTITRRGTLTMQVAHDREAAEEIFRIVQPGRMHLAEDRITVLERNDIRRNLLDRIVTASIAFAVSAAIALHGHFFPK